MTKPTTPADPEWGTVEDIVGAPVARMFTRAKFGEGTLILECEGTPLTVAYQDGDLACDEPTVRTDRPGFVEFSFTTHVVGAGDGSLYEAIYSAGSEWRPAPARPPGHNLTATWT